MRNKQRQCADSVRQTHAHCHMDMGIVSSVHVNGRLTSATQCGGALLESIGLSLSYKAGMQHRTSMQGLSMWLHSR
jgi:hypothetical protein